MNTNKIAASTGESIEYAKIYIQQQVDYLRLESAKRIAKTTSNIITIAVVSFLSFMVLLFLSVAAVFFLGSIWNSYGWAFLFITMFYALMAVSVYYFKRQIITNPIITSIVHELLD